jgi:hypothetical protein
MTRIYYIFNIWFLLNKSRSTIQIKYLLTSMREVCFIFRGVLYRCTICKLVVDIPVHIVDMGKTFFACTICHAGQEGGAKDVHEDVWEYLG